MFQQGWSDHERGVHVKPLTPDGNDISIMYNGLLAKSGAQQVYLHCGYGDPLQWRKVEDYRMQKLPDSWKKTFNVEEGLVTFCFHDSSDNWDNNNGHNWNYKTI